MAKSPRGVSIRTYNVGFGDCFLLSFDYGGAERHVLIDFGSTGFPPGVPKDRMMQIANDIRERTKRKLHAVVATHRHKDHISGFATKGRQGDGRHHRCARSEHRRAALDRGSGFEARRNRTASEEEADRAQARPDGCNDAETHRRAHTYARDRAANACRTQSSQGV